MSQTFLAGSLVALALAASIGGAHADDLTYTFSFTGDGVSGSGTLVTAGVPDPSAPLADAYDILSIDGTIDGDAITGLLGGTGAAEDSADGYFIYDNDFYPAGAASPAGGYFDDDGLLVSTAETDFNLFFDGTTYWLWQDQGSGTAVTFSAADPPSVPEPSSLWLFGAMLGCFAVRWMTRRGSPPQLLANA